MTTPPPPAATPKQQQHGLAAVAGEVRAQRCIALPCRAGTRTPPACCRRRHVLQRAARGPAFGEHDLAELGGPEAGTGVEPLLHLRVQLVVLEPQVVACQRLESLEVAHGEVDVHVKPAWPRSTAGSTPSLPLRMVNTTITRSSPQQESPSMKLSTRAVLAAAVSPSPLPPRR
ncbi:uncharacterized protein [Miscanthus floridulus]|uniref:uncharacterized protein n=1 Tax=Miscanthus floridulus TaxID=154761 RepID=UPI0034599ADA